jgi:hypothetical protein
MGSQLSEELARTTEDVTESLLVGPYGLGEGAGTGAFGPVEEFPPVAPEALGPIPFWTCTRRAASWVTCRRATT